MKKVLVVALGQVGLAIYEIIKECGKFKLYGLDLDEEKTAKLKQGRIPRKIDFMHICFQQMDPRNKGFERYKKAVLTIVKKYRPKLVILHGTVQPTTTEFIASQVNSLVVYSPVRGMHRTMKEDILTYIKYVGGTIPESTKMAVKHLKKIGLKVDVMSCAREAELAKLFETSYTALQITAWQEMHRIAKKAQVDLVTIAKMLADTTKSKIGVKIGPVWFPDVIEGHCLIPNLKILTRYYDSALFKQVLESNKRRKKEMNAKIRGEIEVMKDLFGDKNRGKREKCLSQDG